MRAGLARRPRTRAGGPLLGGLTVDRERFCRGELSYSKVRAITRVATPASEADLVMLATHGTAAHVERIVAALRRLRGPADSDQVEQIYQRTGITTRTAASSYGSGSRPRTGSCSARPSNKHSPPSPNRCACTRNALPTRWL